MKSIIKSIIILILYNSFLFGMFSFGAWSLNPACWHEGTRVMFAFISAFLFVAWLVFVVNHLHDKGKL